MEVHKKYLFVVVASIVAASVLGVQGFVASAHSAGTENGLTSNGGPPPHPLTLNTIDYALRAVGDSILIPDASRIGSGYRVIGVQLYKPQFVTTNTGFTWRNWGINFFISDRPFVNTTSMTSEFAGHLVVVMESVSPAILNSRDKAISILVPQQVCRLCTNGTRTCTDVPATRGQLLQIRNVWLVVDSKRPNAAFTVDGINREFYTSGDMSYSQMLALADSVIP